MFVGLRPVPSLRGSQGGRAPLTGACAPHLGLLKILFLEHYSILSDKATHNDGKRNKYIQT